MWESVVEPEFDSAKCPGGSRAAIGGGLMGERAGVLRPLPVYVLGGLSAMWCIERGLEVLA